MKRCMIVLFMHRNDRFEELARDDSLVRKFEEVPSILNGVEPLKNLDVELLRHVRNEIIHYYPRNVEIASNVPDWLEPLIHKNVLRHSRPAGNTLVGCKNSNHTGLPVGALQRLHCV